MKKPLILLLMGAALIFPSTSAFAVIQECRVEGNITSKRLQTPKDPPDVSVFTGAVGERFQGSFLYNTETPDLSPSPFGFYGLLRYEIDGANLNVSTGTIPFQAGILVSNGLGFDDSLEVRGFHLPAVASVEEDGFNDNGSTSIFLSEVSGNLFMDDSLPTDLDLNDFDDTRVIGPIFTATPSRSPRDEGVITDLICREVPLGACISTLVEQCVGFKGQLRKQCNQAVRAACGVQPP